MVRNFLSYLAETSPCFNDPLVIEPADVDETAMIEEGMREYEKDSSRFTNWKTVKKEMGLEPVQKHERVLEEAQMTLP